MTNFDMPMFYETWPSYGQTGREVQSLKAYSIPGLADVGVPHGLEDGPRTPSRCLERTRKLFQMTNFTMGNNSCSMKLALKSVPSLADVWVLHGDGDGPRTPPRCLERSGKNSK